MKESFADKIQYIIWDWNGTLIDDVQICLNIINQLLKENDLPQIGLKTYRRVFTFPVRKYYETLGFDFSKLSFEHIGNKFIDLYNARISEITLQPGSKYALEQFRKAGKKQVLISARKQKSLEADVNRFGLTQYFDQIIGLDNDLAYGKEHLVRKYFNENQIDPKKALFIGDTEYDCLIAKSLNAHYFLVANGHHSADKLMLCSNFVYANLFSLIDFFFNA